MWSGLIKAISPQPTSRRIEIIVNPLTTPPHFPPFERKSADGQFEIVHAPTRHGSLSPLSLPSGLLVLESSASTPRNDLLHDILISIPSGHWTRLFDQNGQSTALQTVLLLIKSPLIREIHQALTNLFHEGPTTDRTHIYTLLGLHLDTSQTERNPTPPYRLCATFLAWKRECHNFTRLHELTHSPISSTDSLVDWLISHINSPSKLHQCNDFYDVFADIATKHTSIRISIFRQHLTSHEGRISILNHIIKDNLTQWFLQFTTSHTLGPTLQIEQPILSQLSSTLHQYLSAQLKWGYFLSSTSSRLQLAIDWLAKNYLAPSSQPKHLPAVHQLIRTIPVKFCIRDNIIIEPETLTEIIWVHDKRGTMNLRFAASLHPTLPEQHLLPLHGTSILPPFATGPVAHQTHQVLPVSRIRGPTCNNSYIHSIRPNITLR